MSPSSTKIRVGVHPVDLHRHVRRPRRPELRRGHAGVEEQRPARARARLRELLRRHHPEREAGVDELARQLVRRAHAALDDLAEADLLGVRHTLVDASPKVRPSKRSGVCTVWPARRSSSAKAWKPAVCPCAWWKSNTSAISPPSCRVAVLTSDERSTIFDRSKILDQSRDVDQPSSIPDYELADRLVVTAPAQLRAHGRPAARHDPGPAARAGGDGGRARRRSPAAEEHRRAPRERPRGGGDAARRAYEAGTRHRRALLRPHGARVLRRSREPSGRGPDDRARQRAVGGRSRVRSGPRGGRTAVDPPACADPGAAGDGVLGSAWMQSFESSRNCPAPATPCTASPPASTRPTTPPCPARTTSPAIDRRNERLEAVGLSVHTTGSRSGGRRP